jgi:hypothetical protein
MRKAFAIAIVLGALSVGMSFAATVGESPFVPMIPEVMGQGGALTASAHGYNSFFYNPAGFSRDGGSFTLADGTAWIYSDPAALLGIAGQLAAGTSTPTSILGYMNNEVTTGGFGIGASAGIGYVGNGLGLGMVMIMDSMLYGPSLLGVTGNLTATIGFIGGLSVPFDVLGMKVHVGGDIRPMIRVNTLLSNAEALSLLSTFATPNASIVTALNSANALYGVGIGIDLGTIAEAGWFTFGLSIRDLAGTQFRYDMNSFGSLYNTFTSQLKFPTGAPTTDQYVIPMNIMAGLAIHPNLGAFNNFVDPSISVDLTDVGGVLAGTSSPWTNLHAGLDLRLLSFFTLRGGLNQGYLTMGAGLKLLFLDLNFALFTQELGMHIGDRPSSGATLDLAIRW